LVKCRCLAPLYDKQVIGPEMPDTTSDDCLDRLGHRHIRPNRNRLGFRGLVGVPQRECGTGFAEKNPFSAGAGIFGIAIQLQVDFVVHETSGLKESGRLHNIT
jgi:hypothetical protein